jgi:hypothetical protein
VGGSLIKHAVVLQSAVQLRRVIFINRGNKISASRNFTGYGTTSLLGILITEERGRLINCVIKMWEYF